MNSTHTAVIRPSSVWIAPIVLYVLGIGLAFAGSLVQADDAATTHRLLRSVPWLVDICGDYAWPARAVPPLFAGTGAVLSSRLSVQTRAKIVPVLIGIVITVGLVIAVSQNAVPIGVQDGIVDPPLAE